MDQIEALQQIRGQRIGYRARPFQGVVDAQAEVGRGGLPDSAVNGDHPAHRQVLAASGEYIDGGGRDLESPSVALYLSRERYFSAAVQPAGLVLLV